MKMQDKEFDDLFRSKLDNFEIEPSAEVWSNIDGTLDAKERKRSIFPILRIAASVVILIAAGILFIPKKENVHPARPHKNQLVNSGVKPVVAKQSNDVLVNSEVPKKVQPENTTQRNRFAVVQHPARKTETTAEPAEQTAHVIDNKADNAKPVKSDEQPILAVVTQKPADIPQPVVPGNETPLAIKQTSTDEINIKQPVLAAAQKPVTTKTYATVKRRGIHNMGDLVNLVLAKVDKRKDKVIEFTDTDDDESTITAVNMGPIKIKKEK
jgi:hypothetical protein